jgi:hypothetical protein
VTMTNSNFVRPFRGALIQRAVVRDTRSAICQISNGAMTGKPILNKVFSEVGNVDARRGADVFLEILLNKGMQYIFARKLVGENRYVSSVPMKRQEGSG